jgi:hypothetical protein
VKQRCGLNQFIEINDKLEMCNRVFISNNLCRGKSKTAERQKERESVRDRVLLEMRDSIGNKKTVRENICFKRVRLISEVIKMLLMMLFP